MTEILEYNNINDLDNIWDDSLSKSKDRTVFLTINWLKSWLNVFSNEVDQQVILCVTENNEVIALAPLMIKNCNEYGFKYKRLQFIGFNQSDYMDFVIIKKVNSCLNLISDYLFDNSSRWDLCELNNFSEESNSPNILKNILRRRNKPYSFKTLSVCPYVKLDLDITEFLKTKKSGLRYDLKRGEKDLCKLGELNFFKIENQADAVNELPAFMKMLSLRDNQVKRIGTIESYIDQESVYLNYLNLIWDHISFSKLTLNEKVIAYHFGFEYDKKLYWYKPTFDINYIKFSPGKILIKKAMENAYKNNIQELDFLLGDEPYKFQWAKQTRKNFGFLFGTNNIKSKLFFKWFSIIKPNLKSLINKLKQ